MVTVRDLIALLTVDTVNPDAEVFVWLEDGTRYTLDPQGPVDAWGQTYLDLNITQRPTQFSEIDQEAAA